MEIRVLGERVARYVPGHSNQSTFELLTFAEVQMLSHAEQMKYEKNAKLYLKGKL